MSKPTQLVIIEDEIASQEQYAALNETNSNGIEIDCLGLAINIFETIYMNHSK